MSLIRIKNLNKYYPIGTKDTFHVLKNIKLDFNKGELVSIVGESGSGKSTIMNILGGLDSSFDGEVLVNNKNLGDFSEKELDEYRKNNIGFVFQSSNLIPHLSILDNVMTVLSLSNIPKQTKIELATSALESVGLGKEQLNKRPNALSGGQRQRVAIARALVHNPDIILADEPTGALDAETTSSVLQILKDLSKTKLVIMVTHSDKVASSSDRVIRVAYGKIIEDEYLPNVKSVLTNDSEAIETHLKSNSCNLSFISSVKFAGKNIKQKLHRNILVSCGISIGISSLIVMSSLGNGLKTYFSDMIKDLVNPLVTEVTMPFEIDTENPSASMQAMMGQTDPFEQSNIDELSKIENVVKVEKGFSFANLPAVNSIKFGDEQSDLVILESLSSAITTDNLEKGNLPKKGEVIVNKTVANSFKEDLIGKSIEISISQGDKVLKGTFKVSGIYKPLTDDPMANIHSTAFVNFDDMNNLFESEKIELPITSIFLVAENEENSLKIKEAVSDLGYNGSTEEIIGEQMLNMLNILTIVLTGISGISLVVSAITVLVILNISVVERTKELGLLRAIGYRAKDIKRIFVSEAFILGLSSGILGIVTSTTLSIFINKVSTQQFNMEVMKLTPEYALFGLLTSIIISCLAGLIPAKKAAKLDPVESLRTE